MRGMYGPHNISHSIEHVVALTGFLLTQEGEGRESERLTTTNQVRSVGTKTF